jgi:hypothetical protein
MHSKGIQLILAVTFGGFHSWGRRRYQSFRLCGTSRHCNSVDASRVGSVLADAGNMSYESLHSRHDPNP